MREIRFRLWDKVGKRMYDIGHLADIALTTQFAEEYGNNLLQYELMQYTGLLDRNGKEIYEGDIVERKAEATGTVLLYGWVSWKGAGFYVQGKDHSDSLLLSNIEVIGNIYENGDLLK